MKEIKLSQGKVALVDDEDFEVLNRFKWSLQKDKRNPNSVMYAKRLRYKRISFKNYKRTLLLMHRVIINAPDNMQVDHINRNGLDNRKSNLRLVVHRGNMQNKSNNSQTIGVRKVKNRYRAEIQKNYKSIHLGYFDSKEDAIYARQKKYNEFMEEETKSIAAQQANDRIRELRKAKLI